MAQIAIVDDNEAWCFVLATVLEQKGHCAELFTNAHAFLQRADQFDLALIDFSIPARAFQIELDGIGIIQHLKTHLSQPPLLILISSYFTDNLIDVTQDFCPEADLILSKQINADNLLQHIDQLIATRSSPQKQSVISSMDESSLHVIEVDTCSDDSNTELTGDAAAMEMHQPYQEQRNSTYKV